MFSVKGSKNNFVLLLLAVAMSLMLAACGEDEAANTRRVDALKKSVEELNAKYQDNVKISHGEISASEGGAKAVIKDLAFDVVDKSEVDANAKISQIDLSYKEDNVSDAKFGGFVFQAKAVGENSEFESVSVTCETTAIEGLEYNREQVMAGMTKLMDFAKKVQDGGELKGGEEALMRELMGSIEETFASVKYKKSYMTKLIGAVKSPADSMGISIDSIQGEDYSLFKAGPSSLKNMVMTKDGADIVRIESVTSKGQALPSFWFKLYDIKSFDEFRAMIAKDPLTMGDTKAEKIFIDVEGKKITIDEISYSADMAKDWKAAFAMTNLSIPAELLKQDRDFAAMFANISRPLVFSGAFGFQFKPADNSMVNIVIDALNFSEKELGSFNFKADLSLSEALLDGSAQQDPMMALGGALVNSAHLAVKDSGFSDLMLAAAAPEGSGLDAAAMRQEAAQQISQIGAMMPPLKELADAVAKFCTDKGGLEITLAPKKPVSAQEIMANPAVLGISAKNN